MAGDLPGPVAGGRRLWAGAAEVLTRGLNSGRAAEVRVVRTDGSKERGSGYLLRSAVLLTAQHVVRDAASVQVRFTAYGTTWTADAKVRWSHPEADVALLALARPDGAPLPRIRKATFGSAVKKDATLRATALGFPVWKLRQTPRNTQIRESAHVDGRIALLANGKGETLEFLVPPPADDPSSWKGMSGAAVWAQGRIVGIVAEHHPQEGPGRLTLRRADRWMGKADEPGVRALREVGLTTRLHRVGPWRRARRLSGVAVLLVAGAVFGVWRLEPAHRLPPLSLTVSASCRHVGQELFATSAHFTPGGAYRDEVRYPSGQPYPLSDANGTADPHGSVSWHWNCSAADEPGTYHLRITDERTGRQTAWLPFTVEPHLTPYTCRPDSRNGHWYEGISDTNTADLAFGSAGPDVAEAQCLLKRLGYTPGPSGVDGVYGGGTQAAVRELQHHAGIPVDGRVGPGTWRVLRA